MRKKTRVKRSLVVVIIVLVLILLLLGGLFILNKNNKIEPRSKKINHFPLPHHQLLLYIEIT